MDILNIVREYESGSNVPELSRKYKINLGTLYARLNKAGTKMRSGKFQVGTNTWLNYTPEQAIERKKKASERMCKYNPMFDTTAQMKSSARQKRKLYGLITHRERKERIREKKSCEICTIDYPLVVHHRDNNRYNQDKGNLQVLCCNCHYILHHGTKEENKLWK